MLEIWASGNVAFSLLPATSAYCNGQFVVNASLPGAKNIIATLLAAKTQDRQIRVASDVDGVGCITADGYGGNYIKPVYVYLLD